MQLEKFVAKFVSVLVDRADKLGAHSYMFFFCSEDKRYVKSEWMEVHAGDFVHLACDEIIPADILLLHSSDPLGICHLETSNLDGETNLKQRQIVHGLKYQGVSQGHQLTGKVARSRSPANWHRFIMELNIAKWKLCV